MGVKTLKVFQNDFEYTAGRLTVLTGLDALAQIIGNRLKLGLGEHFADPDAGIDWITLLGTKQNVEKRARLVIRQAINAESRVTQIKRLEINFDNSTREMTVELELLTTEGIIEDTVII